MGVEMTKTSILNNEKGMATIETIPLILVFVFMLCYELGMFGIIHTGIMHSISARAYAFETFKNRSNLYYFRDSPGGSEIYYFKNVGNRTHGVASELKTDADNGLDGVAAERPLRVGIPMEVDTASRNNIELHNKQIFEKISPGKRNQDFKVNPVFIQVQYGICMNVTCGDN